MMHPTRALRCATAAAAITTLTGFVSACATGTPSASATRTVTVSASPTAAATAAATATTQPSPAPATSAAAPAGPAACPTRHLKVRLGLSQGAAGSVYQVLKFTNAGATTCSLYGYPGVSLMGGNPLMQIGLAAKEDPSTPRTLVKLAPGAVANALLRVVQAGDFPQSRCLPVSAQYLRIYPPNQTSPVFLHYLTQGCSKPVGQLTISVVKAGSGG